MARFSPAFLDEVLSRTDIVELIGQHVELKKAGSNLMGLCPFHHEKTPSFSVSPDKQLYYCFGCGKGGGAFQFLMEYEGYSFPEAVEFLAEKAGMAIPKDTRKAQGESHGKAYEILSRAAEAFRRALASPEGRRAREYLRRRGVPDTIAQAYALGYAPAGYHFMRKVFAASGSDARMFSQLESLGLLLKGKSGYIDLFRDRLMFAIRDRRGRVVGFGGRVLDDGEPKYLNSPETPLFHKSDLLYGFHENREAIRKRGQLVVVEGYMDVLALAAHGLKIGLAPLGTAITERQIRDVLRLHDAPVFCFDGDQAGRRAAWRSLERMLPLLKPEHRPRFLYLPEGEDPDSLIRREGADAFARRLAEEARPVLQTWLAGLKSLAGSGAEGRARMAKKADEMLGRMRDDYLRQAWRQEIERATGISLRLEVRRARRKADVGDGFAACGADLQLSPLQERFLSALLQKPQRFLALPDIAGEFFIDNERVGRIYSRAFSMRETIESGAIDVARRLIGEFPEEQGLISRLVNQAVVTDLEFASLLLDMEANAIRRRIRQGVNLPESIRLRKRLDALRVEQARLGERLHAMQANDDIGV